VKYIRLSFTIDKSTFAVASSNTAFTKLAKMNAVKTLRESLERYEKGPIGEEFYGLN
jgi:hypothetical protein